MTLSCVSSCWSFIGKCLFIRTSFRVMMLGCWPYRNRISISSEGSVFVLLMTFRTNHICYTLTSIISSSIIYWHPGSSLTDPWPCGVCARVGDGPWLRTPCWWLYGRSACTRRTTPCRYPPLARSHRWTPCSYRAAAALTHTHTQGDSSILLNVALHQAWI